MASAWRSAPALTLAKVGKTIRISEEALEALVDRGYSLAFGARFLKRVIDEHIKLPSRIFVWLALVFGGVFSILALVTRRWVLAWIAVAGTAVSAVFGMLAVWSRQTLPLAESGSAGPGIGLILGWITVIVLTFHWIKVVWSRTAMQLAAEEERRRAAADDADHGDWTV